MPMKNSVVTASTCTDVWVQAALPTLHLEPLPPRPEQACGAVVIVSLIFQMGSQGQEGWGSHRQSVVRPGFKAVWCRGDAFGLD